MEEVGAKNVKKPPISGPLGEKTTSSVGKVGTPRSGVAEGRI